MVYEIYSTCFDQSDHSTCICNNYDLMLFILRQKVYSSQSFCDGKNDCGNNSDKTSELRAIINVYVLKYYIIVIIIIWNI